MIETLVAACTRALALTLLQALAEDSGVPWKQQQQRQQQCAAAGSRAAGDNGGNGDGDGCSRAGDNSSSSSSSERLLRALSVALPPELKASLVRVLCGYRALTGPSVAHLLDAQEMGRAYTCLPARGCCLLPGGALAASFSPGPWLSLATLCLARVVALADCDVTAVVGACPALTDLDVSGCCQLTGRSLGALAAAACAPRVRRLVLSGVWQLESVHAAAGLEQLRVLELAGCWQLGRRRPSAAGREGAAWRRSDSGAHSDGACGSSSSSVIHDDGAHGVELHAVARERESSGLAAVLSRCALLERLDVSGVRSLGVDALGQRCGLRGDRVAAFADLCRMARESACVAGPDGAQVAVAGGDGSAAAFERVQLQTLVATDLSWEWPSEGEDHESSEADANSLRSDDGPRCDVVPLMRACVAALYRPMLHAQSEYADFCSRPYAYDLAIAISTQPQLTALDLSGSGANDRTLQHLSATCTGLVSLVLARSPNISDHGVAHLAALTRLTRLDLSNCSGSSARRVPGSGFDRPRHSQEQRGTQRDDGDERSASGQRLGTAAASSWADEAPHGAALPSSKRMRLEKGGITDVGVAPVVHALCSGVEAAAPSSSSAAAAASTERPSGLRLLALAGTGIGNATLMATRGLTALDVSRCRVTDHGTLQALMHSPGLTSLQLSGTSCSPAALGCSSLSEGVAAQRSSQTPAPAPTTSVSRARRLQRLSLPQSAAWHGALDALPPRTQLHEDGQQQQQPGSGSGGGGAAAARPSSRPPLLPPLLLRSVVLDDCTTVHEATLSALLLAAPHLEALSVARLPGVTTRLLTLAGIALHGLGSLIAPGCTQLSLGSEAWAEALGGRGVLGASTLRGLYTLQLPAACQLAHVVRGAECGVHVSSPRGGLQKGAVHAALKLRGDELAGRESDHCWRSRWPCIDREHVLGSTARWCCVGAGHVRGSAIRWPSGWVGARHPLGSGVRWPWVGTRHAHGSGVRCPWVGAKHPNGSGVRRQQQHYHHQQHQHQHQPQQWGDGVGGQAPQTQQQAQQKAQQQAQAQQQQAQEQAQQQAQAQQQQAQQQQALHHAHMQQAQAKAQQQQQQQLAQTQQQAQQAQPPPPQVNAKITAIGGIQRSARAIKDKWGRMMKHGAKGVSQRIVLYPHYITRSKTVAEGRRVPKELACDNPNVLEMQLCCAELQLQTVIEDKHYPRDWTIRCRLRVLMKKDDGSFVNPAITSRRALMLKIAELQPKHRRPLPQGGMPVPAPPAANPAVAGAAGTSKAAAGVAGGKGKGKKK
ncbi:hypothetical protein FOA52_001213 [Chlamydomonas sp. UWO 241]|nr:hypothetical protein FOA52_001213 [Chlamydomonas sp. UWO 241]